MISSILTNKKIIALVLALIVLPVLFYVFFIGTTKKPPVSIRPDSSYMADRVLIKDFYKTDNPVSQKTINQVERMLYNAVQGGSPDLYTGLIRKGSYSSQINNNQVIITSFLVDIEPTKITRRIFITSSQGHDSIDIVCPLQKEQIDPSQKCDPGEMT